MQLLLEYGGYIIAGVLVVLGMFGVQVRQRRGENDTVASNLITNLQTSLDLTEKNLKETNVKLDETTKQLHLMQGRNTVLEQLFNGSEGSIISFLKQTPELQRIAEENNALAKATSQEVRALTASIDRLVSVLTPKTTPVTTVTTTTA